MIRSRGANPVSVGDVIDLEVMRWDDGWEFDCPTVILSPRFRVFEDGRSIEQAVEDFLVDVCCAGQLPKDHVDTEGQWAGCVGRRWTRGALRQRKRRIKAGQASGQLERHRVQLVLDDAELFWQSVPAAPTEEP